MQKISNTAITDMENLVEIKVQPPAHRVNRSDFLKILKCKLVNKYIREGASYKIRYFGQRVVFEVTSIKGCEGSSHVVTSLADNSTNSQDLSIRVAALDISSNVNSSLDLSLSLSSTPLHSKSEYSNSKLESSTSKLESSNSKSESSKSEHNDSLSNLPKLDLSLSEIDSPVKQINNSPASASSTPLKKSKRKPASDKSVRKPTKDESVSDSPRTPVKPVSKGDELVELNFPVCSPLVKVTERMKFVEQQEVLIGEEVREKTILFDSVGGLDEQIAQLRTMCVNPLMSAKQGKQLEGALERSILLCGVPGTGKSLLAEALVNKLDVNTVHITPANVHTQFMDEGGKKLLNTFMSACKRSPSIIVMSQLHALCPEASSSRTDAEKRRVDAFCSAMDWFSQKGKEAAVVVVGVTSKVDKVDSELLRRFGTTITTSVPTVAERHQILEKLLRDVSHDLSPTDIKNIADGTHAFVGDDLLGLLNHAIYEGINRTGANHPTLTRDDFRQAAKSVEPSAIGEAQSELHVPKVRWSDIGGQEDLKLQLRQMVEWPLRHGDVFQHFGVQMSGGLLMFGPPGCSKTMIAKAVAGECGLNFFAVKGPELLNMYVGESERAVRDLFHKARSAAPAVIFFDEIDSIAVERGGSGGKGSASACHGVMTQLLTEMDGIVDLKNIILIAATNRPDKIDAALLRPGRLSQIVYVPLPDSTTRRAILELVTKKTPVAPDVSLQQLVEQTEFFSGAELTELLQRAAYNSIREFRKGARTVHMRHLEQALQTLHPQTTPDKIRFYEDYYAKLTSH